MQAECTSSAYRLWKRQWKGRGQEYCSGALVWQLNDCWACTSWSIVDYYLRPKLAYFAVKRELRPITIGLKRTAHTTAADPYTRAYRKIVHKIEMWACNLSLDTHEVFVHVKTCNLLTGEQEEHDKLGARLLLLPNRSTEISEFEIPVLESTKDEVLALAKDYDVRYGEEQQKTVVAAYLCNKDGDQFARAVNCTYISELFLLTPPLSSNANSEICVGPEPLKHAYLPKPKNLELNVTANVGDLSHTLGPGRVFKPQQTAASINISSDVPIKGFVLEVDERKWGEDHEVAFEDSGIDLIPGEIITIGVQGLKCGDEDRLTPRYLGM